MAKKPRFYAVVHGHKTGIFNKWDGGARMAIDHFPEAHHRAFSSLELAEEWYRQNTRTPRSNHSPVYHFDTEGITTQQTQELLQPTVDGAPSRKYIVYAIIDPDTQEPFYVGETGHFPRRQRAHIRTANERTKRAAAKIAQILAKGQEPIFKAVEFCDSKKAALTAETQWIKRYVERGYTVWNRLREHREIQELHNATKIQMGMIIGDGPFHLGPHHYPSRYDLKTKLQQYLSQASAGRITHPVATEKLRLIWGASKPGHCATEFWIEPAGTSTRLKVVQVGGDTIDFDYASAIDRL